MRKILVSSGFIIFVLLFTSTGSYSKDDADALQRATDKLEIPLTLSFLNGDCNETITSLKDEEMDGEPWLFFQLGICSEQQDDLVAAVTNYENYVALQDDNVNISVVSQWIEDINNGRHSEQSGYEAFLVHLQKYQLRQAAELFHQKPDISDEDLNYEINAQQIWLTNVLNLLGSLGEFHELSGLDEPYYSVLTGGADLVYWKNFKGEVKRSLFEVEFDNFGRSHVVIESVNVNGKWEIRFLYLLFPQTPESKDLIHRILSD